MPVCQQAHLVWSEILFLGNVGAVIRGIAIESWIHDDSSAQIINYFVDNKLDRLDATV